MGPRAQETWGIIKKTQHWRQKIHNTVKQKEFKEEELSKKKRKIENQTVIKRHKLNKKHKFEGKKYINWNKMNDLFLN